MIFYKIDTFTRITVILFFSLLPLKLFSCECIEIKVEQLKIDFFKEVFLGKIIHIDNYKFITSDSFGKREVGGIEITFEVLEKWKGQPYKTIKLHQQDSSCSTEFNIDEEWIICTYDQNYPQLDSFSSTEKISKRVFPIDACFPIYKKGEENFEKIYNRLNHLSPNQIQLKNEQYISKKFLLIGFIMIAFLLGFIFGRNKSKNN